MIMENVIIITCHTFIKMPAHMEDEFIEMRTIIRWTASRGAWGSPSYLLDDHVELPPVPLLAVHLVMVLISMNSSSMCAGILIKV